MAWKLRHGDEWVSLDLPEEFPAKALAPAPITPLLDPVQAVRDALDSPSGSPRLRDLAAGARHVLIVVPDHAGTGLAVVLPQVLDVLQDSGVGLRQVEILVATGMRGRLEADEMESIVGSEVWNRVVVRQHDPLDDANMTDLGESERGTPLILNRKAVESGQLLILAGAIAPDPYCGFEGGPQLVLPGLASRVSGMSHSRLALNNLPDTGVYEGCRPGELDGNIVYEDSLEGADKVDADFLVHTVVDEGGRLVKVVAGEWRKAFESGCDWLRGKLKVTVHEERAWAVASAGGHAGSDASLFQAHRLLIESNTCVRNGGHLVFMAACPNGFGSDAFEKWMSHPDLDSLEKAARASFDLEGRAAIALRRIAQRIKVHLVSPLPAAAIKAAGFISHATLDDAWKVVAAAHPDGGVGYIVPHPDFFLPVTPVRREVLLEERPGG